jgi:soluble lytic murein transglycosylase-like protein
MRRVAPLFLLMTWIAACGGSDTTPTSVAPVAAPSAEQPPPQTLEEVREALNAGRKEPAEAALRGLVNAQDAQVRADALATLATLYDSEGRLPEAEQAYRAAAAANPDIASFLELGRVRVLRKMERYADAITAAEGVVSAGGRNSAAESARIELAALHALAGNREEAARRVADLKSVSIDSLNDHEFTSAADLIEKAGDASLADALRMRVVTEMPSSRFTEQLYARLTSGANAPINRLDYTRSLELTDRLGRANRYDQALDLIRRIEQRFPQAKTDPALRYTRTVALFNSRNYDQVVAERVAPGDPHYLDIQFRRGRAFWRSGKPAEFLKVANEIVTRHPNTRQANDARILLSNYYMTDEMDLPRSARYMSEVIKSGTVGNDGQNIWTLAWIYILARDDAKALSTMADYVRRYPEGDYASNSLFWSGKLHERNGRTAERDAAFRQLIEKFPFNYYSYRAREIMGTAAPAVSATGGTSFPSVEADHPRLEPVRKLMDVGFREYAAREMQRLSAASPNDRALAFALADLYVEAGEPARANALLQRHFREFVRRGGSNVPQRFWSILYPLPFREEFQAAAAAARIDPFLLPAIARQESGFNPTVISNAGAVGVMQIMPEEAPRIASVGGLGPITRADLFDARKNIRVGAAEIRQKLDAMKGNQVLAIAAYNAGEKAVGRWIANTPMDDIDFFIESIPFAETRLYVKSVTRNLFEYRRIYGGPTKQQ